MTKRIFSVIAAFILAMSGCPFSLAGIEDAQRMKLENGLEIVFVENHSSPIVSSNLFIRAGSATEPAGMNGASHLLEHLLFNGTERRSQKQLYDDVDLLGAYNNAFTREDYTCFQMIISSSLLEEAFDIQADMLFNSTIAEEAFEKEKKIVIEEIGKDRGNPDYLEELVYLTTIFEGTPYSEPVLGSIDSVMKVKRDDLFRYYKQYYVPNNMTLFLIGDFAPDEAVKLIKKYFGAIDSSKAAQQGKSSFTFVREKNLFRTPIDSGRNYLRIITRAPDLKSPDFVPFQILMSALSEGDDSRLGRRMKSENADLVIDFSLDNSIYGEHGILQFYATLPQSSSPEAVAEIYLHEIQKVAAEGLSIDEVEIARKYLRSSEIYQQEQFHYYPVMRGQWIALAPPGMIEQYLDSLDLQSVHAVNDVARKYLTEPKPLVTITGPGQAEGSERFSVPEYKAGTPDAATADMNMKRKVLDNGMTVIAKKDESSRIFALHLLMKNRSMNEPDGKTGIADFTHRMLEKGTALMDSAELSAALKEIGANVKYVDYPFIPYDDYYTTPLYSYIRFEVLSEDWRKSLKLLRDIVFRPSFPEAETSNAAVEMKDIIAKNDEKVSSKARDFFFSKIFEGVKIGNSVYGSAETIGSIHRDDLVAFHRRYFSPQNMIVSVVSDLPPHEAIKEIEGVFGAVKPAGEMCASMPSLKPTMNAGTFELQGGKEQSYVYMGYLFHPDADDIPALTIANAILSDRMAFDLREKRGLAYMVGSSLANYGDSLLFLAAIGTRPGNIEEAISGMKSTIEAFASSELTEHDLTKTRNSMIGRSAMRRVPAINRAYFIGLSEFEGKGVDDDLELLNRVKSTTTDAVKKAAAKYFQTSNMIIVIAR